MGNTSRSRVLMVTTSTGTAGAERVVASLARGLVDYQIEVVYLSGAPSELDQTLPASGTSVHYLGGRRTRPFELTRRLRALVQRVQPALVHSHLHHANLLAARALQGRPELPLIHTVHIIERRFRPLRPLLERRAAMRAARVVGVSAAVVRHLAESGWPAGALVCIRNGIELDGFATTGDAASTAPVVLGLGRLDRQKGFDLLLRAFALVLPQLPDARLEIAGTGPAATALRHLADRLGIAARVEWLGLRADVPSLLSAARVLAFPSRYEGFGLVLAEAGAAARPVVAFDLPTTREIVRSGETGLVVPTGDLAAFAAALVGLLRDPSAALALGVAARSRVVEEFGVGRMVAEYRALYDELLLPAGRTR